MPYSRSTWINFLTRLTYHGSLLLGPDSTPTNKHHHRLEAQLGLFLVEGEPEVV
jgi:hypothetical protein